MPLLIQIVVALILAGFLYWLITLLPLPPPFPTVIRVVVVIALILWLVSMFWGGFGGLGFGDGYHEHWRH
jgi:hypothetical protein